MGFFDIFGKGDKETEKKEVDTTTLGINDGENNDSMQNRDAIGEIALSSGKVPFIREVYEYLKYCGLVPNMDDDRFIFFNYQMINIIFGFYDKIPGYVTMIALDVAEINDDNRIKAYELANQINEQYVCIKVICNQDSIGLHLEHIFKDMDQFKYLFRYFLNIIVDITILVQRTVKEWLIEGPQNISNN